MRTLLLALTTLMFLNPAYGAGLQSTFLSGSATAITTGGGIVVGFHYNAGTDGGLIQFRSPSIESAAESNSVTSGSTVRQQISTAGVDGNVWVVFPQPYLDHRGGLYITLTNVDDITIFYK